MKIAYIRVSTAEQNEARQILSLKDKGIEKYYIEKASAKNTDRPQLCEMLDFIRSGDVVYIDDFSRLARSTEDLLRIVNLLNNKGVHLISNKENLDTSTPTGKLMLTMIAAINTFERENMLERQREGIAIAKKEGRYKGGQPKKIDKDLYVKLFQAYSTREINKSEFAKKLGVSRPTLDKLMKKFTLLT